MIDFARDTKLSSIRTMLADCFAKEHPLPIAKETSAVSRASTSFKPSPTTTTLRSINFKPEATISLSIGSALAMTLRFSITCLKAYMSLGSYEVFPSP